MRPELTTKMTNTIVDEMLARELTGLCRSCDQFENCVFRKKEKRIVIYCELFNSDQDNANALADRKIVNLGLCSNCDNVSHCKLPRSAGGVWHCEEYS